MTPGAVVFDCDGVLVDSEPHSRRSWAVALERLGHPGTEADVAACTGLGFAATRDRLLGLGPLPPPETLWPLVLASLADSFTTYGLVPFEDAVATLDAVVAARIPYAVASASPRERLDLTLRRSGLASRFAVSIAGDEVPAGKPAPDGYLAALARLGVMPADAVAIEDSVMGVRSATAAGMRVIAVVREPGDRAALVAAGAEVVDRVTPDLVGL